MDQLIEIKQQVEEGVEKINKAVDMLNAFFLLNGGPLPLRMRAGLDSHALHANTPQPTPSVPPPARPSPRDTSPRRAPSSAVVTPFGIIPAQRKEKWTLDQVERLVALHGEGLSYAEIGCRLGKTGEQCRQKLKNLKRIHRDITD